MIAVTTRRKFQDLEHGRLHLAALKELVLDGNASDARGLRRITALCRAAHAVLKDPYCSLKIAALAECAAVWFSTRNSQRPELYLEQLLDLLDLLQSRIYAIEAIRRASRASITS
jgi:hypothetical protein